MKEVLLKICELLDIPYYEQTAIMVVDDISLFVNNDDRQYYLERKEQIDQALGLFYERCDGQIIILIKNIDIVNIMATLVHEYIHFLDYQMLSKEKRVKNYRLLQEDYIFLFWTEYHATYESYRYLIKLGHDNIDPREASEEIRKKLVNYYKANRLLAKQTMTDITIRSYASYMAFYDEYPGEVDLHPKGYYYNKLFLDIFDFLKSSNCYTAFIQKYSLWKQMINSI